MIIWLASYPRSGNTFFRILLKELYGQKTYSIHDDPLLVDLEIADVVGHENLPPDWKSMDDDDEPVFIKTHRLPEDDRPAIYIVRDGRDALVSHAKFVLSFKRKKTLMKSAAGLLGFNEFEKALYDLIEKKPQYGGWSAHARAWVNDRGRAKTAVVRYEDLVVNPKSAVESGLTGVDLDIGAVEGGQPPDFESLRQRNPEFFRKGKVGAWRDEFPQNALKAFMKHHGATLKQFGYSA